MKYKGSPLKVFSYIKNVINMVENDKEVDLTKLCSNFYYDKQRIPYRNICNKIFNDIENSFYSYKDLTNTVIFIYYMYKEITFELWGLINKETILHVKDELSNEQFKEDKKFLLKLKKDKKLKLNNINDLFEVKTNGESIIFSLFKKEFISPITYIKLYDDQDVTIEFETKEYKHFRRISKFLTKQIKE